MISYGAWVFLLTLLFTLIFLAFGMLIGYLDYRLRQKRLKELRN